MTRPFEVVEKSLEKRVITRFLETNNAALVADECGINYFNLINYLSWVKENKPEWLEKYGEDIKVDVFRVLNKYVNKIEKKLDLWETQKADLKWLQGIKSLRDYLSTYTDALERLWNIKKQQDFNKMIIDTIREESPETASKIIKKLKELEEQRKLLGSGNS